MIETKTFWKVKKDQTYSPGMVKIMYIDGEAKMYGGVEEDSDEPSCWSNLDSTDDEFFASEDEAFSRVKDNRKKRLNEIISAVDCINAYHNTNYLLYDLDEVPEDAEEAIGSYKKLLDYDGDDMISKYTVRNLIKDAVQIALNRKAIHGSVHTFFLKDIVHATYCKDEINNKYFFRIYFVDKTTAIVYNEDTINVLKAIYGTPDRVSIHNGELNFLNK